MDFEEMDHSTGARNTLKNFYLGELVGSLGWMGYDGCFPQNIFLVGPECDLRVIHSDLVHSEQATEEQVAEQKARAAESGANNQTSGQAANVRGDEGGKAAQKAPEACSAPPARGRRKVPLGPGMQREAHVRLQCSKTET